VLTLTSAALTMELNISAMLEITSNPTITFDGSTIARSRGSWATDGFAVDDFINVQGSALNNDTYKIDSISLDGRVITLTTAALTTETVSAGKLNIFAAVNPTIIRDAGSWLADEFAPLQFIEISGTSLNNGVYQIQEISVDGATVTLGRSAQGVLRDEGPVSGISVRAFEPNAFVVTVATTTVILENSTTSYDAGAATHATYDGVTSVSSMRNVKFVVVGDFNAGDISAPDGNVDITATGSIFDRLNTDAPNITAINVNLLALGGIGELTNPLETDLVGSRLDATADGDIFLTEVNGDMEVGLITSTAGDVTLVADGSILDVDNDAASDITAARIDLTAQNGQVGTAGNALEIDSTSLQAQAQGSIHITEVAGDLNALQVTSAAADVMLVAFASILDASGTGDPNITATGIDLTALNGGIGAVGNDLDIDSSHSGA